MHSTCKRIYLLRYQQSPCNQLSMFDHMFCLKAFIAVHVITTNAASFSKHCTFAEIVADSQQ